MIVVLVACPARQAARISRTLVETRLAACVSRFDGLVSEYRWEGKIERAAETLLLIKAPRKNWRALRARILAMHPYKCPEILAFRTYGANPAYAAWADREATGKDPRP